jgi:hypothetical protein
MKGALEVGKASTVAFVWTSVSIIQLHTNAVVIRSIMIEIIEKSFGDSKILKGISSVLKLKNQSNHWTEWFR